ncbi:hypothetical protein [Chryseobacterium gregarium]|nr:hypothetical protein [Chryseobacterium gregarium]
MGTWRKSKREFSREFGNAHARRVGGVSLGSPEQTSFRMLLQKMRQ